MTYEDNDDDNESVAYQRNDSDSDDSDDDSDDEDWQQQIVETVSVPALFRYADKKDVILMLVALLFSMGNGIAQPTSFVIFGKLIEKFIEHALDVENVKLATKNFKELYSNTSANNTPPIWQNMTGEETLDIEYEMRQFALYYVLLALGMFVCAFFQASLWSIAAVRQVHRIRLLFFRSVLKQDIGWFDINEGGGLTTRLSDDLLKIQAGMGDKVGATIQALTMFFAGFGLGFYYSWKLTLIILSLTPAILVGGGITGKVVAAFTSREQTAYADAGSVAEEVISSIRTVAAFGGQRDEIQRYDKKLSVAEKAGIKKAVTMGASFGFFHIVIFSCYALAFWKKDTSQEVDVKNQVRGTSQDVDVKIRYGSRMVADGEITSGSLLIVFFCVMMGASQMGSVSPNFGAVTSARGAAFFVYGVCKREPLINCFSEEGKELTSVRGDIELNNVHFRYPSRPEVKVLDGFNLTVMQGMTVALVGESGCGKSTIIKLIQRFYDCEEGAVNVDEVDIKELKLKWHRGNIGVVSQEPVLFDMSIAENISFGSLDGVTQEDIEKAAQNANAHDFIISLPKGYDTKVGEGGAQLSGGQKQRIAIARALVRDPKILLFDEATSALDTESEGIVQAALEKASKGRTTILIAHRLSTVRNADMIVAIKDGKVAEMGTHDELMEKKGVYHDLVLVQTVTEQLDTDEFDDDKDDLKEALPIRSLSQMSIEENGDGGSAGGGFVRTLSNRLSRRKRRPEKQTPVKHTKPDVKEETKVEPAPMSRILKLSASEWRYLVTGSFFSAIVGAFPVAFAIILSNLLLVFTQGEKQAMKRHARDWALGFLALGVVDCIGLFFSAFLFGKAGEILTRRIRRKAFRAILRQDISFFDLPENSTGQLTARLATDASNINGATSTRLNTMTQVVVMLLTALGVSFYYSWMLTLLIVGFAPFLILAGSAQTRVYKNFAEEEGRHLVEASSLANQAIMNIRTVASLGKEAFFVEQYRKQIDLPYRQSTKKAWVLGLTFGASTALMMLANAAAFTLGGHLVQKEELKFEDMFKVVFATVFGAIIAGQIASFAPDYLAAKVSAARVFKLLDAKPKIDTYDKSGDRPKYIEGNISFDSINFNYPTRPDVKVLKQLSFEIQAGQKVALVGASGCGKSTSLNLLERFYDPLAGSVQIDDKDITHYNIQWLRSQLGLVSQEPVLFSRSIKDNICYGMNRAVEIKEVIQAAMNANIHNFITDLPKGYDTMVGEKGTLISGGQKQRIAIARALIRNPKIMLLDEATSALDSESEKIVQQALDVAMEGRTSIIIAHRLSTVQNADKIIVIQHGRIVETGTHQELLAKQGVYYLLNQAQF